MLDAVADWSPDYHIEDIGLSAPSTGEWPSWTMVHDHGVVKSSLMTLGVEHHHDGSDIIIPSSWEGLLDGLGLEYGSKGVRVGVDAGPHISDRVARIKDATKVLA